MATLNRLPKIFTHEGARAACIDPVAQLERSVMSCLLWEDEFYEDGQSIGAQSVPLHEVTEIILRRPDTTGHAAPD